MCFPARFGLAVQLELAVKRVVLADSHEVFRTGIATTISTNDGYRIVAQCSTSTRLLQAVSAFPGCVAIVAASLGTDLEQLRRSLKQTASQGIAIAEDGQSARHFSGVFHGIVSRDMAPAALMECIRQVTFGRSWISPAIADLASASEDWVGMRVRDRLTNREIQVAALLLQGYKNREISLRLGASEQVVKNCFRTIYEKSGVGDRLELALFIHHHGELAKAVAEVSREIEADPAPYSSAVA